jgi:transcriptional regulator with XRE-family HTH domain
MEKDMNINFYKDEPGQGICETIRLSRQKMGYTQAQVAECIRMSTRQYVKYENGLLPIGEISFQQGVNLCELLHIEIYKLITPIEEMLNSTKKTSA